MFKFLTARHRATYIALAFKFFTTPWHVYALAHGKSAHGSKKDKKIQHELLDLGIIHRHHTMSTKGNGLSVNPSSDNK